MLYLAIDQHAKQITVCVRNEEGDTVHFTMPKAAVLRTFVFNHIIHHRGQLAVYLRMLEVPVPGMYGPSADEAMACVGPWAALPGLGSRVSTCDMPPAM